MGKCEIVIQVVEFQFVIGALALGKRFLSQVCNNVLFFVYFCAVDDSWYLQKRY